MSEVLHVRNLLYVRQKRTRLFQTKEKFSLGPINLTVNRGETVAIIGENRAGKSLLARLLVGALSPQQGEIYIDGESVHTPSKRPNRQPKHLLALQQRARASQQIRMIFQHSAQAMNPAITVGAMLDEALRLNTDDDELTRKIAIDNILSKVGMLREHAHFYRHMLSDGQQQRVSLARAIILQPKVLVADEPFAALDPTIRSQTVNMLLALQKEFGLAFVFISHNLGIVRHMADRVVVMENGQIVETGRTEAIFRWPRHETTKKLVMAYQSLIPSHN